MAMETTTTNTTISLTRSDRLSARELVGPATRCIILALVLTTSTGILIRELIATAFLDLLAFLVGSLWLIGDILPCVALLFVIHDVLLAKKKDNSEFLRVRGKVISFLDAIVIVFIVLYFIDIIIVAEIIM